MAKDKTPSDVSKMIKDNNVKLVDYKFTDLLGTWQHFTTTLSEYNDDVFADGLGFDGSSIRGWKVIDASDMIEKAVSAVVNAAKTGKIGDGKVFVLPVEHAVRIRTEEIGERAV